MLEKFYIIFYFSGCAVPDPATDSVIVIAGYSYYGYSTNVTRYNDYGFMESLPPLNVGRVYAGCSGYYNEAGNLVTFIFFFGKNLHFLSDIPDPKRLIQTFVLRMLMT